MPRKHRPGTTPILAHVSDDVHAAADKRRRREGATWTKVFAELLQRWAAGDEEALAKPVRFGRPKTPEAEESRRLHERAMETNEAYRRAASEKVDPSKLVRYRSFAQLLAAGAAREGRKVSPEAVAAVESEDADDDAEVGDV